MKILVQNLAVEYEDAGSGQTILFLHGWQDNLRTFDLLMPHLAAGRRIIRLDLPGFGKSELPREVWDVGRYVEFVNDFIQNLHVEIDVLAGHSFGGRIILKGVGTGKLEAEKIVLIGSAGIAKNRALRSIVLKTIAKIGGLVTYIPPFIFWRTKLRKKMYGLIGSGDYLNAGPLKETFLKIIAEDLTPYAKRITVPTLLIWGANDAETPLADGQKLARLIIGSRLNVVHMTGHFAHQERPAEVARLIQEFL